MPYYLDPDYLKELVAKAQQGDFTQELLDSVLLIAKNMGFGEDCGQNAAMILFIRLPTMDLTNNVFGYLTEVIKNERRKEIRNDRTDVKKNIAYANSTATGKALLEELNTKIIQSKGC